MFDFQIVILTGIALLCLELVVKKTITDRLNVYLSNNEFEKFEKIRKNFLVRIIMNPVNLLSYDLTKNMLAKDDDKILEILDTFVQSSLSPKKKMIVINKVFYYFVKNENSKISKYVLDFVEKFGDEKSILEAKISYDTYIKKGAEFLDQMLEILKGDTDRIEKAVHSMMISQMYMNLNDIESKEKYQKIAEECLDL